MHYRQILIFCVSAASLAACAPSGDSRDSIVDLRILETSDLHMHVVDYDYFQDQPSLTVGLARTAALLAAAREESLNSVLVDNGDLLQGNPLGDFMARQRGLQEGDVHPVYKAMNLLDYTVGNIGNHEFNYGLEFLEQSIAGANFPYISANVFHDDGDDDPSNDQPYFQQYLIVDRTVTARDGSEHDIRIGFIGFVPPQIMQWDASNLRGRVVARDIVATANALIPEMKAEGADIVVAIPHSGISTATREGMEEQTTYYLSLVPDIDAIMFGHSHRVFPSDTYAEIDGVDLAAGTINGVAATMPGFWGSHLGFVDLELSVSAGGEWSVVQSIGVTRPIYKIEDGETIALVEPLEEILAATSEEHQATIEFVNTGVGKVTAPINSYFALVQDDPSVQVVTNAQTRYVTELIQGTEYDGLPVLSASAPFKTGGRGGRDYYTEIAAGDIALKHISDLYIYPNTLRAVAVTGAQVREWLEMSAGLFNQIDPDSNDEQELIASGFASFNFDVIDGVDYRIDLTQPARYSPSGALQNPHSHRIVELRFNGEPIDMQQTFVVATNNYRADGGGGFPGLDGSNVIITAPDTNRDVLADYIFDLKTLDPSADDNWAFAPINDDVLVTFSSSPRAVATLQAGSPISKVGDNENGSAKYRLGF
ncbi:MAG: bifunctional 2',3'-cyclic-nucleotide 2'-phosphodiesterase/3'-nucleotidase [Woeseiaceae bacterium]